MLVTIKEVKLSYMNQTSINDKMRENMNKREDRWESDKEDK